MRYDLSNYDQLIDEPLDVRQGCLCLSDRPGLGVNLNPEALACYEAKEGEATPDR